MGISGKVFYFFFPFIDNLAEQLVIVGVCEETFQKTFINLDIFAKLVFTFQLFSGHRKKVEAVWRTFELTQI